MFGRISNSYQSCLTQSSIRYKNSLALRAEFSQNCNVTKELYEENRSMVCTAADSSCVRRRQAEGRRYPSASQSRVTGSAQQQGHLADLVVKGRLRAHPTWCEEVRRRCRRQRRPWSLALPQW